MDGLCECGCGGKTRISNRTSTEKGWIKGEPRRFIHHHHQRGENHYKWGGGHYSGMGYQMTWNRKHPKAGIRGYVQDHVLIAESVLGKYLPPHAVVHHVNGVRDDNRKGNLVVCENRAYHNLLHQRIDSMNACGHATWRKCFICKQYDKPENIRFFAHQTSGSHKQCYNKMRIEEKRRGNNGRAK